MNNIAQNKKNKLIDLMKSYGKVIIAFSGGVDSTFLLKVAKDALQVNPELSEGNVVAVTLRTTVFPEDESNFAAEFCENNNIEHKIIDIDLLANDEFVANHNDRCYICKKLLFEPVVALGAELGIISICEGSIADDEDDYRPGKRAIAELGVLSPMKEVGLTKDEIRFLSKEMGLPTWDKPSMACLASRFPYETEITEKQLRMVEKAEKYLFGLNLGQIRVRIHGDVARIEVEPDQIQIITAPEMRERIYEYLTNLGFTYVALDLKGYRTGSMNETISTD